MHGYLEINMGTPIPWNDEFLVNTNTDRSQSEVAITALPSGRFVVAWKDTSYVGGDTVGFAVHAQVFKADGTKAGSELLVNTTMAGSQRLPSITALHDGNFVVAWEDSSQSGGDVSDYAVRAQLFSASGVKVGGEFLANTTVAGRQTDPTVTALENGRFVIAWEDYSQSGGDTSGYAVRAQLFNANGTRAGGEFLVNTATANSQMDPATAALANGGFVVAWTDISATGGDDSGYAVHAQIFDASGGKSGPEFRVNTTTTNNQWHPAITVLANGNFVVAWEDYSKSTGDTSYYAIRAQVFNANGGKVGTEFLVNSGSWALDQTRPALAALPDGRFVAVWEDEALLSGGKYGSDIYAQLFNADGSTNGSVFHVGTTTAVHHEQYAPSVTPLADGRFVVAWEDDSGKGGDTWPFGVFAQIFDPREAAVRLSGTSQADDYVGTPWKDSLTGKGGNDLLNGGNGNDTLTGSSGNDTLKGGGGNDLLNGGPGKDTLLGGPGKDFFLFNALLNSSTNVDKMTDFSPADDTMRLENAIFAKLTGTGPLSSGQFRANANGKAMDANDFIIYNTTTGALFYDADGSGGNAAVKFATLGTTSHPALTAADFVVI